MVSTTVASSFSAKSISASFPSSLPRCFSPRDHAKIEAVELVDVS